MASDDDGPGSSTYGHRNRRTKSNSEDELSHPPSLMPTRKIRPTTAIGSEIEMEEDQALRKEPRKIQVVVAAPARPWDYTKIATSDTVEKVLKELKRPGDKVWYQIQFEDGRTEEMSLDDVMKLRNGPNAIGFYNEESDDDDEEQDASPPRKITLKLRGRASTQSSMLSQSKKRTRGSRSQTQGDSYSDRGKFASGTDDEDSAAKRQRTRFHGGLRGSRLNSAMQSDDSSSGEAPVNPARVGRLTHAAGGLQNNNRRSTRSSGDKVLNYDELTVQEFEDEDTGKVSRRRSQSTDDDDSSSKRPFRNGGSRLRRRDSGGRAGQASFGRLNSASSSEDESREPTRRSGRTTKTKKNMRERLEDDEVFAENVVVTADPKIISIREVYQPLPTHSPFRNVHNSQCDTCNGTRNSSNKGPSPLIHCQGCSTSIHKVCLGYRSQREHMVTKVGEDDFVMQCRNCIGTATKKDATAPRLDICQTCKLAGASCAAFSQKKTPKQEQKLRDENGGSDPITPVDPSLINSKSSVLFRCTDCRRGFHFDHLPPLDQEDGADTLEDNIETRFDARVQEYSQDWKCKECIEMPAKPQVLVAWRPADVESHVSTQPYEMVREDEKEYLIKWTELSYFKCTWMPGSWVWGITTTAMRKAFARRESGDGSLLKRSMEDAIPEEFLRMEIIMNVKYSSRAKIHTEEGDKARVNDVSEVFVKFVGLGYDEIVWESPPSPDDGERWKAFVAAYNEYVAGKYFKQPPSGMKDRIQKYRNRTWVEPTRQPETLTGGKLMDFQLDGANFLLYKYRAAQNVILADEMGLGKTVQIIAMLAALVEKPQCWPFLVVVPNSTCPNWRREIQKWAPSLRVVAYYGAKRARDMAMEYELYPKGCSDLRAHVVVTSFESPVDEHSRYFFRKIKWAGLVVDEGQRLKNDGNLLYGALSALRVPFRVLLTGTPLQNNKKELFNLIHFIDNAQDASELDEKYQDITNDNLPELKDLIRPYLLRRTKAEALDFLPPMAQVIIPVTMSVVQKKLYKSILAKSPELIQSIMSKNKDQLHKKDRGNLNNLLVQLRKCLCHPFVYSESIEERDVAPEVMHRNLIDAASKLQLLEIMLPKLQKTGHRVLIFSQFLTQLDIMEDFLEGLRLPYQRLDGTIGTLEKQKRIDAFNAPDSPLFAFLLSTRAGGVGINLATADTVIIMDPDFNPHQDMQALARAHRIGQERKVLALQFMTRDSAEEKIVDIGRKKLALDHVLIESMDDGDDAGDDVLDILKHGAQALFNDDDTKDIKYDSTSVDNMLDRSQIQKPTKSAKNGDEKSAESQFSQARVWANDKVALVDDLGLVEEENPEGWAKLLAAREAVTAAEAAAQYEALGRGKRNRQTIKYGYEDDNGPSPEKQRVLPAVDAASDESDFNRPDGESAEEESDKNSIVDEGGRHRSGSAKKSNAQRKQDNPPRRGKVGRPRHVRHHSQPATHNESQYVLGFSGAVHNPRAGLQPGRYSSGFDYHIGLQSKFSGQSGQVAFVPPGCLSCSKSAGHLDESCPVKQLNRSGEAICGDCGIAHFRFSKRCLHLCNVGQLRLILDGLVNMFPASQEFVDPVRRYVYGVLRAITSKAKIRSITATAGRRAG